MLPRGPKYCIAVWWLVLWCNAPLVADVVEGESDANGAFVDLTAVAGTINADIGPLAPTAGSAPAPYDLPNQSLDVALSAGNVPLVGNLITLNTDAFNTNAFSNVDGLTGPRTTSATTLISGLNTTVGNFTIETDLITITADTIEVVSELAGDFGAMARVGSVFVENLQIRVLGQLVDLSAVITDGFIDPNTSISLSTFGLNGATLALNQQITSGDGVNTFGIETNAIVLDLSAVTVGGFSELNGNVTIGHTAAFTLANAPAAVPEPSSLILMAGLALTTLAGGGIRRLRRQKSAAA